MTRKRRIVKVSVVPTNARSPQKPKELEFPASEVVKIFDLKRGEATRVHAGALIKGDHWLIVDGERMEIVDMDIELSDDSK